MILARNHKIRICHFSQKQYNRWKFFHLTQWYEQGNNKLKLDNFISIGLWGGMALVALAWIKAIPLIYGWFGFAIAVPSFIMEAIIKKNRTPSNIDDNSE